MLVCCAFVKRTFEWFLLRFWLASLGPDQDHPFMCPFCPPCRVSLHTCRPFVGKTVQKNQMLMMTPGSLGRSTIMKSFIKQSATKTDSKVSWDVFRAVANMFRCSDYKDLKCASPSRSDLVGNSTSCLSPSVGLLLCGEYKRSESRWGHFHVSHNYVFLFDYSRVTSAICLYCSKVWDFFF